MNAQEIAEFKIRCAVAIDMLPAAQLDAYTDLESVCMDKGTALDADGEPENESCQMCGKPLEHFPTKRVQFGEWSACISDRRDYVMTHPETGTRFEWTVCPTCAKTLRLSGVRQEAHA